MSRTTDELVSNLFKESPTVLQKPKKLDLDKVFEKRVCKESITSNGDGDSKNKDINNQENEKPQLDMVKPVKLKTVADNKNVRIVKNIGFESLPNQIYLRSLRSGFQFNVMVCGCSGLGKSTFINSLFLSELYGSDFPPTHARSTQTTKIESRTVNIAENNVRLRLSLIDTPGFGESVDNSDCWKPVVDYLETKFNDHMMLQNRVDRRQVVEGDEKAQINQTPQSDNRVHVMLYFIEPTGHKMKSLDIEFLSKIHHLVNVVLVIGKADTMMPDECAEFKKTIWEQVRKEGLKLYEFPEEIAIISMAGGSNNPNKKDSKLRDILSKKMKMPFAVVSSNAIIDRNGAKIRGRAYPWGIVEVDNLDHNDFTALRVMLLSSHLQDLIDTTDRVHFEKYRSHKLRSIAEESKFGIEEGRDPMSQMDEERKRFKDKIKETEENMQNVFNSKVNEKTKRYEEKVAQVGSVQQGWLEELEKEIKEIEQRRAQLESDRLAWEEKTRNSPIRQSTDQLDHKEKKKRNWLIK